VFGGLVKGDKREVMLVGRVCVESKCLLYRMTNDVVCVIDWSTDVHVTPSWF
jgi:hypothetical protein